ncbi:MAG: hypothetical protein NW226_00325 [Microscillaceae bacterium]|nr:hypothetical protein [Microscillaceae bacterium]
MKKQFLILVLLSVTIQAFAQREQQPVQTLVGRNGFKHHGFYGAPVIKMTSINDEFAFMPGIKGGWIINRAVALGFEGYGLAPSIRQENIVSGTKVRPLMGYGGFFIEPIIQSNKLIHITTPVLFGGGWVGYVEDWERGNDFDWDEGDLIDDQLIWVIEPGVNAELNVANFFRLGAGLSYRFTEDVELINTKASGFRGMNYNITLKFGRF